MSAAVAPPPAPADPAPSLPSGPTGLPTSSTPDRTQRDTPASASASVEPDAEGANTSADAEGSSAAPAQRVRKKRLGVDPSLIISEERSKRRRSPSPSAAKQEDPDSKDPARAAALGREIMRRIMEKKASDGESMSEPFLKLPNKRQFPDYYEMIKHPMCLEMVETKLNAMEYQTLREICGDLGQMFTNAKRYNIKESLIFQYAKKLHKMTRTFYSQQTTPDKPDSDSDAEQEGEPKVEPTPDVDEDGFDGYGDGDVDMSGAGPSEAGDGTDGHGDADSTGVRSSVPRKRGTYMKDGPTVYKLIKPVLKAIKEARSVDGSGREIAGIFLSLPDRRDLPDYYKAIKQPISIKEIEEKMLGRKYDTYEEFFEDVELMCANAMVYNEDESEVYKDAQQIRDILGHQRAEVIERLKVPKVEKFRVKAATVTPVRFGSASNGVPPYDQRPSPLAPYGASPTSSVSALPYGVLPQTAMPYPALQNPLGTAGETRHYLPPLPTGVVNEEIVASLEKYPLYERTAWASTLAPRGLALYQQILATYDARKRAYSSTPHLTTIPPPPAQSPATFPPPGLPQRQAEPAPAMPYTPAATRPAAGSPLPVSSQTPHRGAPSNPLIKRFDFTCSARSHLSQRAEHRPIIRLHNLRGVVTHAVLVGSETSEIELTAYAADGEHGSRRGSTKANDTPIDPVLLDGSAQTTPSTGEAQSTMMPDMTLRVNGNPAALPRRVYEPSPEGAAEGQSQKVIGVRWLIPVPFNRAETKIEVSASRPGATSETSTIYVNRQ